MSHLPYSHRAPPPIGSSGGRLSVAELLDNLKTEFENTTHEVHMYKMQRDDLERKLTAQLTEFASFQQTLYELEKNHQRIKAQYEEEILILRRQLENANIPIESRISEQREQPNPEQLRDIRDQQRERERDMREQRIDQRIGDQRIGDQRIGDQRIGDQRIGEQRIGDQRIGDQRIGEQRSIERIERTTPVPMAKPPSPTLHPPPPAVEKLEMDKDWIVGYNPGVQTSLTIDLMHNLNHSSVVCCVKFSADGKFLATGCNKGAHIYDVETGRKEHTFVDGAKEGDLYVRSVGFSPDGRYLATGAEDKTVKVWDIQQKRLLHTFTGHELDIYSLDFSPNGRYIVSGSGDKKAKVWDVEKERCVFTLGNEEVGPKDGVTSVAISPDGLLIAAGSLDRVVRLWDAHSGYFLERYEGHTDSVYSVAFSPDGKSLVSGSLDKSLKLWDLAGSRARSRCRSTLTGHKDFVLSVAFSPDGNWLASGSKDRSVQFWDPRASLTPHMMLQGHKNSVISVAISPAGGVCATGSGDHKARLWKFDS